MRTFTQEFFAGSVTGGGMRGRRSERPREAMERQRSWAWGFKKKKKS